MIKEILDLMIPVYFISVGINLVPAIIIIAYGYDKGCIKEIKSMCFIIFVPIIGILYYWNKCRKQPYFTSLCYSCAKGEHKKKNIYYCKELKEEVSFCVCDKQLYTA